MPGRSDKVKAPDFDVSRARQLIAESSYRDVRNFPEIVLSLAGNRTSAPPEINAVVAMLRQNLGVEVKVRQFDRNAFMDAMAKRKNQFQLFFYGWLADYADPQNFLDLLFHSKSPENGCQYASPDVDRLLERARSERDGGARFRLYQEAESQILRDSPWVPLWHSKRYVLVKSYVQGYASPPVAYPWLRSISLSETPPRPSPAQSG